MKRRTFIFAAFAIVAIPFGAYWLGNQEIDPLITPKELGKFCDDRQLRFIGETYLRARPEENKKEKLISLLLDTDSKGTVDISKKARLIKFLDEKIINNFFIKI